MTNFACDVVCFRVRRCQSSHAKFFPVVCTTSSPCRIFAANTDVPRHVPTRGEYDIFSDEQCPETPVEASCQAGVNIQKRARQRAQSADIRAKRCTLSEKTCGNLCIKCRIFYFCKLKGKIDKIQEPIDKRGMPVERGASFGILIHENNDVE